MNQTLTEHHIAQYNILLIEDQTVNQTKPIVAIVFVYHVFTTAKFNLFLAWYTITECTHNFVKINSIYFSHGRQYKIAA